MQLFLALSTGCHSHLSQLNVSRNLFAVRKKDNSPAATQPLKQVWTVLVVSFWSQINVAFVVFYFRQISKKCGSFTNSTCVGQFKVSLLVHGLFYFDASRMSNKKSRLEICSSPDTDLLSGAM